MRNLQPRGGKYFEALAVKEKERRRKKKKKEEEERKRRKKQWRPWRLESAQRD